jgi:hypothetical protein
MMPLAPKRLVITRRSTITRPTAEAAAGSRISAGPSIFGGDRIVMWRIELQLIVEDRLLYLGFLLNNKKYTESVVLQAAQGGGF